MKLKGKVALVTGSSTGIGAAMAKGLAAEGADLVINYRKDRESAEKTVEEIKKLGRDAFAAQANVGIAADVEKMFAQIKDRFSRLDVLVNNAGIYPKKPFEECDENYWDLVVNTNLKSIYLCCKQAAPLMARGSAILNVSSIHATNTLPNCSIYAATKGGIEAFTRGLATELASKGIRVNGIRPGFIQVERAYLPETEPRYKKICERILVGRPGCVEDLVPLTVLLCSEDSSFITGEVVNIDGGHAILISTPFAMGFSDPKGDNMDAPGP